MNGMAQTSLASVLPPIKRRYLRKYSWLPDVFRLKGSVIPRIVGPVLTVTIFSSLVCYAATKGYKFILTNSIFPLLSIVVGLVLVFRTSYDRFWEGRKSFASITSAVRNFSRQVWINVAQPPPEAAAKYPTDKLTKPELHKQKVEALHLALAFAFAVKHYLRGEDGIDYLDYDNILPASFARYDETGYNTLKPGQSIDPYESTLNPEHSHSLNGSGVSPSGSVHERLDATKRVRPKRSKQKLQVEPSATTPLLSGNHRIVEFHPYAVETSLPLPLVIAHQLSKLVFRFRRDGFLETVGPAGANAISQLIQSMVDQLTAMERVANTPIPTSYSIHLKQCITLYLFALPLTLVNDLGYLTIPIVTVVAFTFMGIEGIADEIEMPFGTDECDLPLDRYCQDLKEEVLYIIERLPEGGEGLGVYDDGEGDD
ncbi:hypothetical protein Ac2012v2_001529 [Leucoagaricus gongylophorus]